MEWVINAIQTRFDQDDLPDRSDESISQALSGDQTGIIEQALQTFWNDTVKQGTSHKALRKLNFTLIDGGVTDYEQDSTLIIAAKSPKSPQGRMQDKNPLMRVRRG